MTDPYLVALHKAVEGGAECPPLWMTLHSGDRVTGTPRPARAFVDGTFKELVGLWPTNHPKEARSATRDQRLALAEAEANRGIAPFNVEIDTSGGLAMTLANATVLFGGRDDGVRLPVARVHLSAVVLWWLAGGEDIKGGGGFFAGVMVPLNIG